MNTPRFASPVPAPPPRRNVEQKFRCDDLHTAHARAVAAGAAPAAVLIQRDVYFAAPRGRLKLRSIMADAGARHELIAYDRPDADAARASAYHLVPVADAPAMEAALGAALGVRGVVTKRRTLLLAGNLRIHLDEVDGLGDFVELEALLGESATPEAGVVQVARWRDLLGLTEQVPDSYIDLRYGR